MKRWTLSALFLLIAPVVLVAAPRSFTDQEGESIKAEMAGVKNGQVLLKEKTTLKGFALSSFSLDDRDYIIKWLKDKRHTKLLSELMQAAVREIGGGNGNGNDQPGGQGAGAGGPMAGGGAAGAGAAAPPAGANEAFKSLTGSNLPGTKTMYTLTLPTGELMKEQEARSWSDIMGDKLSGTFDHIEANGAVVLKEGSGQQRRVPLVLFSREDIDYLIATFKEDLDAEVFPKGGFVAPTPAQQSSGYRVWTDRRGERLAGKFVSVTGKTVTIEVAGQNKTYPLNGLSAEDRNHISSQQQQNQQQGTGQPIAGAGAGAGAGFPGAGAGGFPGAGGMPPGFGPSGIGARPFSPMPPSGFQNPAMANPGLHNTPIHNPPMPNPSFPTQAMPSPTMSNPAMPSAMPPAAGLAGGGGASPWSVPNAGSGHFANTYEFRCDKCGHTWTRENQSVDKCPKCPSSTRVRIPGVIIGKVLAGICALLGIGYGATKARGEG